MKRAKTENQEEMHHLKQSAPEKTFLDKTGSPRIPQTNNPIVPKSRSRPQLRIQKRVAQEGIRWLSMKGKASTMKKNVLLNDQIKPGTGAPMERPCTSVRGLLKDFL